MKKLKHITIVDDCLDNLEIYQEYMVNFFNLKLINNPLDLCNFLKNSSTDLILLDIHMPSINGMDLYREKLSQCYPNVPVIFITADQSEEVRIQGLELGACDVIAKPISLRELVARINNKIGMLSENCHINIENKIHFDDFTLDCEMQLAEISNKKIHLTPIEFKIIYLLAKNPNKVYSKESMKNILWPNIYVQNQNMDTHLSNLRKKIIPFSKNIKTIKSKGYVLTI